MQISKLLNAISSV